MSEPIITLQNVSKSFGQNSSSIQVLEDLSLDLKKGESLALVGASGSGKSTLLHVICGLEKPNKGNVYIKGVNITDLSTDERSLFRGKEVGFVYQFHHLLPDLTALENIALPAMLSGIGKEEAFEISASLLEQVNLNDKKANRPNELSGGERQRVAIARAMSNNPSCLIMDEPTGNLDKKNVENFMNLLMDMVSTREIALIIATHDNNVSSRLDKLLNLE
jgi:lipoprotein-releasing system ATP-binding protein|tara:strand:+ start:653 stop:1312 length:660 start_codon:yes stop_codon:yes gene_type:complete